MGFKHRDIYIKAVEELDKVIAYPEEHKTIMRIIPLLKNSVILIKGAYGFGKTAYVECLAKIFFGEDNFAMFTMNQELKLEDTFVIIDVASLLKGEEKVSPREIISKPFKFINEVQRGNGKLYNFMLSLFSEKKVIYRDRVFTTPDFVCVMDANPHDSASTEIPRALLDRISVSFTVTTPPENERLSKIVIYEDLRPADRVKNILRYEDMIKIWEEVENVHVPKGILFLVSVLIHNYLTRCVREDKEIVSLDKAMSFCEECRYRDEPCSHLKEPLGARWQSDLIKVARAKAYFEGRNEVTVNDVLFALRYVLPHRVNLKEKILAVEGSAEVWVKKLVEKIPWEMEKWRVALNGEVEISDEFERVLGFFQR